MKDNSNHRQTDNSGIEREISSIYSILKSRYSEGVVAVRERPKDGAACKGIISLFNINDIDGNLRGAD